MIVNNLLYVLVCIFCLASGLEVDSITLGGDRRRLQEDNLKRLDGEEDLVVKFNDGTQRIIALREMKEFNNIDGLCGLSNSNGVSHDVVLTGCEGETRHLTIAGLGTWESDESGAFRRMQSYNDHGHGDHEYSPDEEVYAPAEQEALWETPTYEADSTINGPEPTSDEAFVMEIRYYYDTSFWMKHFYDTTATINRIMEIHHHTHAWMTHPSIGRKVFLELKVQPMYIGMSLNAEPGAPEAFQAWLSANVDCTSGVGFHHLFTGAGKDSWKGVAYKGQACVQDCYNLGITEDYHAGGSVTYTAEIAAHELGHNLGMSHTQNDKNAGRGCTGLMSYDDNWAEVVGNRPWSRCSYEDWTNYYNLFSAKYPRSRVESCFKPYGVIVPQDTELTLPIDDTSVLQGSTNTATVVLPTEAPEPEKVCEPNKWKGYKKNCGDCSALVAVTKNGGTCEEFCSRQGLFCKDAWDDTTNNQCSLNAPRLGCQADFSKMGTSDGICQCSTTDPSDPNAPTEIPTPAPTKEPTSPPTTAPPSSNFECKPKKWKHFVKECGDCAALVKVKKHGGKSCDSYCKFNGLVCVDAWDDKKNGQCSNDIAPRVGCQKLWTSTSDAICQCGPPPSLEETLIPTLFPTRKPTMKPTKQPTYMPTMRPTQKPTTPEPTAQPVCEDDNPSCPTWASNGECSSNPTYMNVVCKKSCGACGDSMAAPTPKPTVLPEEECEDWGMICDMYSTPADCISDVPLSWANGMLWREMCPNKCGMCGASAFFAGRRRMMDLQEPEPAPKKRATEIPALRRFGGIPALRRFGAAPGAIGAAPAGPKPVEIYLVPGLRRFDDAPAPMPMDDGSSSSESTSSSSSDSMEDVAPAPPPMVDDAAAPMPEAAPEKPCYTVDNLFTKVELESPKATCTGGLLGVFEHYSMAECAQECLKDPECHHFAVDKAEGVCTTFKTCEYHKNTFSYWQVYKMAECVH